MNTKQPGLIFGIYPGSGVGVDPGSGIIAGPADDPIQIMKALDYLQPRNSPFLVRGYIHYAGSSTGANMTPANMEIYAGGLRKLDLVLCYRTDEDCMKGWTDFIRYNIRKYGSALAKIQITEEPNNPDAATGGDGGFANVQKALVEGVNTAKDEIRRCGLQTQVGFNASPSFGPPGSPGSFWTELSEIVNTDFVDALDYVGLDFFPDVFRPLPPGLSMRDAVMGLIAHFRSINLRACNIPATTPIHITEHGWPTSELRSCERQAEVVEEVIRTVYDRALEDSVTHYEFFNLRDSDSSASGPQFGLLRDDYTPKPVFEVYRRLIEELG